jgi:hypothetical protein|tara:strand:+ start:649 stop:1182 length:534 start_codon:yes stop_codon:yes gene_type:complete
MAFDTNEIIAFSHSCYSAGEGTTSTNITPPPAPAGPLSGYAISPGAPANFYNLNYSISGQNDDIVVRRFGNQGTNNPHGGNAEIVGILYDRNGSTALHTASAVHLESGYNGTSSTLTCKLPSVRSTNTVIATIDENNLTVYYHLSSAGAGTATLYPVSSGYKGTGPNLRRKKYLGYV